MFTQHRARSACDPSPRPQLRRASPLLLAALALLACDRRDVAPLERVTAPPPADAPTPAPPAEPAMLAAIPPDRRCGEAGPQPTELPPDLVAGRAPVGAGTLRPGERLTLGGTRLHYDPAAWIGTHRAGTHGPVLLVEIDRAEVGEHQPWGAHHELHAGREGHTFVGPYRLDVRAGEGDPPAEVSVIVSREVCPASALIAATTDARSLWLSTEGIRTHTYDLPGELLQFTLDGRGDAARIDITNLGYRHWLEPRPGLTRRFRVGTHLITVDSVTPGPGTRFDGAWKADGDARLHARLRIDPALAPPEPAAIASTSECGDAPARTTVPPALTVVPKVTATRTLDPGKQLELGPLRLDYGHLEIPAQGHSVYRKEARRIPNLRIFGGELGGLSVTDPRGGPRIVRLGRELLRIDLVGPDERLEIRRLVTTCPKEHTVAALDAPLYLWLSPLGRSYVTVPGRGQAPLALQLHHDVASPGLALGSEHAHFSSPLRPELVGLAWSFDDHLVEVVDIVPGPDTALVDQRWQSPGLLPVVHVQLKVTPQPG